MPTPIAGSGGLVLDGAAKVWGGPVIPDVGLKSFQQMIWASANVAKTRVHLFQNDYIPDKNSVLGSFTEATFSGYIAQGFGTMTDQGIFVVDKDVWKTAAINFAAAAGAPLPQTVYGYYVTWQRPGGLTLALLWAQRFPSPFLFASPSSKMNFTLTLADAQCYL